MGQPLNYLFQNALEKCPVEKSRPKIILYILDLLLTTCIGFIRRLLSLLHLSGKFCVVLGGKLVDLFLIFLRGRVTSPGMGERGPAWGQFLPSAFDFDIEDFEFSPKPLQTPPP